MKKIVYLMILCVAAFYSCKEMDDNYKEYVIPNGITYPQKADSLKIYSGFKKVKLEWFGAKDPKVVKAKIFWNNYTDSVEVVVPAKKDTVSYIIENLEENTYTFHVKTYDAKGNMSIPSEVTGSVYGDNYVLSLTDRSLINLVLDGTDGTVNFGPAVANLVYTEVRYTTNAGTKTTLRIAPDVSSIVCPDAKRKELVEYRSVFYPPASIDTFYLDWNISSTPFLTKLPKIGWIAEASSAFIGWGDGGGGQPALIVDDNRNTGWHSGLGNSPPHWLMIDMLAPQEIVRVDSYLPSNAGWRYANNVQIFTSNAPAETSWELATSCIFTAALNTVVDLPETKTGQYLILKFMDSKMYPYMNLFEVDVYGY
jgi:hypothetical protein